MGEIIMKKIAALISAFILCVTLTACNSPSPSEIPDDFSGIELLRWGEVERQVYGTLEEIEEVCDLVVVGTFIEDSIQDLDYHYDDFFGKEIIGLVQSKNTIEVSQVLKGDAEPGDLLNISQGYAVENGKLISWSALTPMIKGDTWVFFLGELEGSGEYACIGDSDGRYPVSTAQNQTLTVSEYSELGVYDRKDFKDRIYNELVEKYGI